MSTQTITAVGQDTPSTDASHREPLQLKGALEQYESFDVTPIIGREFKDVNLKEWLRAENSDELLRDLAITSTSSSCDPAICSLTSTTSLTARSCFLPQAGRPR